MGKAVEGAASVAGEVLRVAKNNPDARAAGQNLARSFKTVTETINVALLPLAMINYGMKRARHYFENKFPEEMGELLATIPDGELVEPKASVAGPALQGLAYSHDEDELKALYLGLLATAMDGRVQDEAHPAYAEIIRQLSANELNLLEPTLRSPGARAIADIISRDNETRSFHSLLRPVTALVDDDDEPMRQSGFPVLAENWARLGLVELTWSAWLTGADAYKWVETLPEFVEEAARVPTGRSVEFQRGMMSPTEFGRAFARAVGIMSDTDQKGEGSVDAPAEPQP